MECASSSLLLMLVSLVLLLSGCWFSRFLASCVQVHGCPLIRHFSFFGVSYKLDGSVGVSTGCSCKKDALYKTVLCYN